jgi:hypothetical protein
MAPMRTTGKFAQKRGSAHATMRTTGALVCAPMDKPDFRFPRPERVQFARNIRPLSKTVMHRDAK